MSVNFEYLSAVAVSTTRFADFSACRVATTRQLICLVALMLAPAFANAADALRSLPRAEECIDVARLNSVSEAERAVLRIEWRAGLARAEESRLLNEMYERIERLQRTTNEIRVLMNAIPSPSARAAANNSPSGLGPSALIPPLAAPSARPVVRPTVTPAVTSIATPTVAPTLSPTVTPPVPPTTKAAELPVAPQPVVVATSPPAAAAASPVIVPTPVAQAKSADDQPKLEAAKATVPNAVADISAVKMNPLNFAQLMGVGLVSVALVVLWWLRRKGEVSPAPKEAALNSAPPENIQTAAVSNASIAPVVQNDISEAPPIPPIAQIAAAEIVTPTSISQPPPSSVEAVAADTSDHEKTLILHAYQAPIAAPTPEPTPIAPALLAEPSPPADFVAEIVNPEVPELAADIPLAYTPAAPPEIPAPLEFPASPVAPVPPVVTKPAEPVAAAEQSEESILELAEMMLAMGLATGAAQKLVDYIRDNPKAALAHWLKLLEIYRENGQRSNFEQAARQLQQEFNIRASDWMRGTTDRPRLEKFDRVFSQVESMWNEPAKCIEFLTGLLHDNRDGQRVGFPQEVAEEILLLIEILKDTSGLVGAPAAIVRV